MSQFKQADESPILWDRIITVISVVIAIVAAIFTALMYFNGSVVVKDTPVGIGCSGFLIKDPPPEMLITTILSKEEKIYIEEKINCSRDRIQKDPKDAAAYTNIGEAERRLGNLAAARRSHQKALELKPNFQEAKIGLALVEEDMGHEVAASQAM